MTRNEMRLTFYQVSQIYYIIFTHHIIITCSTNSMTLQCAYDECLVTPNKIHPENRYIFLFCDRTFRITQIRIDRLPVDFAGEK